MLASWFCVAAVLNLVLTLVASGHAVLSKRDTRAAIGWVGVIWLAPILGVLLYVWLGINRIERRARSLRTERPRLGSSSGLGECPAEVPDQAGTLAGTPLQPLVKLVRDVTRRPLLAGNRVTPLVNGDQAYPAMLQAIDEAERSITLTTYIFERDPTGQRFLEFAANDWSVGPTEHTDGILDPQGDALGWVNHSPFVTANFKPEFRLSDERQGVSVEGLPIAFVDS